MKLDPRTKIFVVMFLSTLTIITKEIKIMILLLTVGCILTLLLGGHLFKVIKRLRKMLTVIIGIIILQSIFTRTGTGILSIGSVKLITDLGLYRGVMYLMRVLNILVSATILSTSSELDLVTGLVQMKVPFDFAFMVAIGIRFMPIFVKEFKETMVAIQLRGIHIKSLKIKEKIDLYAYILTPIVIGALDKAKKISISVEMRGFRLFPKRTAHHQLKMVMLDYIVLGCLLLSTGLVIWRGI